MAALGIAHLTQVQLLCSQADEELYAGKWSAALAHYETALELASSALESAPSQHAHNASYAALRTLAERCKEQKAQLRAYLASTVAPSPLSATPLSDAFEASYRPASMADYSELSDYSEFRGSDLPFASILGHSTSEEEAETSWDKYLWQGLNRLRALLPNVRLDGDKSKSKEVAVGQIEEFEDDLDLDESFVLVDGGSKRGETMCGLACCRYSRFLTLVSEKLKGEIARLRQSNRILRTQNAQLRNDTAPTQIRSSLDSPVPFASCAAPGRPANGGLQELMSENTRLKQSILMFRSEVEKQADELRGRTMAASAQPTPRLQVSSHPARAPTPTAPYTSQTIAQLEATVSRLQRELSAKDAEVQELLRYKRRWERLKQDARQRKASNAGTH